MNSRRNFIKQSGLLTAGLFTLPEIIYFKQKKVGLQLYALRGIIEKDVPGTLKKILGCGYNMVETNGYTATEKFMSYAPKDFLRLLKDNDLSSPSGLYGIDLNKGKSLDDCRQYAEVAASIGQKYLIMPWLFEEWRKTTDDYKWVAKRLNECGAICKKANVQFAYHNHDFEFIDMQGTNGMEILLRETDPDLVAMELDIYWTVRAGANPVALLKKYPGRFPLWHVKDMDAQNKELTTELGNGSINFKEIFALSKNSKLKYAFVEQENFSIEPFESIRRSAIALRKLL